MELGWLNHGAPLGASPQLAICDPASGNSAWGLPYKSQAHSFHHPAGA